MDLGDCGGVQIGHFRSPASQSLQKRRNCDLNFPSLFLDGESVERYSTKRIGILEPLGKSASQVLSKITNVKRCQILSLERSNGQSRNFQIPLTFEAVSELGTCLKQIVGIS